MQNWKELITIDQWSEVLENSRSQSAVILKHSTACPVSASALEEYETYLAKNPNSEVQYYLVKVIESRAVSNLIAEDLNVKHASPQIIFIEKQEAVWNTSHWSVTAKHLSAVLN